MIDGAHATSKATNSDNPNLPPNQTQSHRATASGPRAMLNISLSKSSAAKLAPTS